MRVTPNFKARYTAGAQRKFNIPISFELLERILSIAVYSDTVELELLEKVNSMFSLLDLDVISQFGDRKVALESIQAVLNLILKENITDTDLLKDKVKSLGDTHAEMIEFIETQLASDNTMVGEQAKEYVDTRVTNVIQHSLLYKYKDDMSEISNSITNEDPCNLPVTSQKFEEFLNRAVMDLEQIEYRNACSDEYTSCEDSYEKNIQQSIDAYNRPSDTLRTGIRELNALLGGGFKSERHYTFLGAPGCGKSVFLENCLFWICCCNKTLKPKDPTKIPIVLYCTQENSLRESNERQYSVWLPSSVSCERNFKNTTASEVIELYKTHNGDYINFHRMYRPNRDISTRDLEMRCDKLKRSGYEVVAIIHDYIKRIRCTCEVGDPFIDLAEIVNEEKNIATKLQIPFITAMQVNREAIRKIQEAYSRNKNLEDEINATVIGSSFGIYENTDYCGMLIPRIDPTSGIKFQQFIRLKTRYKIEDKKSAEKTYIAMPYEAHSIRLESNLGNVVSNVKWTWGDGLSTFKPSQEVSPMKILRRQKDSAGLEI